jgi:rhamnosyltransferase
MHSKILAVLPVYYPDVSIKTNILSYINDIDFLIIVNNSNSDLSSTLIDLPKEKIYEYFPNVNIGLSKSYNFAIEYALENKYDYLLLMDQDSFFINNDFWKIFKQLQQNPNLSLVSAATSSDKSDYINDYNEFFYNRKILMSSGTIIFLNIISKIGYFDEKLFIDEIDHDFSLRCHLNGYLNLTTYKTYISHSVGEAYICNFPLNIIKKQIILHKPFRYYHIFKNGRYMIAKYLFKDFKFSFNRIVYLFKLTIKIVLFYPTKLKYFKFIILSFIK